MNLHIENILQISVYGIICFLITLLVLPSFINSLKQYQITQKIREKGLSGGSFFAKLHAKKSGTPTMGGLVIIFSVLSVIVISRLLSYFGIIDHSLLNRGETYLPIFTLFTVGILGMIDDYLNIKESSSEKGLSAKVKFWTLFGFAILGASWFVLKLGWSIIHIPGVGDFDIGLWYFPLFIFILVGVSNSVNLTDGLDGLAGGLLAIAYLVFAVIAYFSGLPILSTFCVVIASSLLAFLWFNVPPASVYMGDTGSLALGATLGVIAMLTDAVLVLAIVGMVFVIETLSVIIQLTSKKYFQKKVFIIAPIHHHFEAKGWSETQIVMRFWIIGAGFGVIGLIVGLLGMGNYSVVW